MSNSMVAVTADGTRFGCAAISLTETGVAVLDGGGSRLGFVPYDSLEYVTPCAGEAGNEDGTDNGDTMTVVATDGSEFSCAAISQAGAGVATLAPSGSRTGFVPYDTLQYVLPPEKTGAALPEDCELPEGIAGHSSEDEAEGVWDDTESEGSDETDAEPGEDAEDKGSESESSDPDAGDDSGSDDEDGIWEDAEESTEEVDPDADVIEEDPDADDESSNDADGDIIEEDNEGPNTDPTDTEAEANAEAEATAEGEAGAEADAESEAESGSDSAEEEEREEAGESELKVEWSFGEYEE